MRCSAPAPLDEGDCIACLVCTVGARLATALAVTDANYSPTSPAKPQPKGRHTALHAVGASVPECCNHASRLMIGEVTPAGYWIPARSAGMTDSAELLEFT
jgi:hypothetical protein